jgi:hypothetical protein
MGVPGPYSVLSLASRALPGVLISVRKKDSRQNADLQVIDLAEEVSASSHELFGCRMSLNVYLCVTSIVHDYSSFGIEGLFVCLSVAKAE